MNILLFGGSFNPPHVGHLIVISQAFELIPKVDEIWILPTFSHTFGKNLAPASHRLNMCRLLIGHLPKLQQAHTKLCSLEIDYHTSGQTFDTFRLLQSETDYLQANMFPDTPSPDNLNFSFLMGSDQLPTFDKWGHWRELLDEMHFYIYPRSGHRHDITFDNMTLLESPTQVITNISSTLTRKRLSQQMSTSHILPASIKEYITQNQLY